jgi:two-component system sensor histidine kinase MtrB
VTAPRPAPRLRRRLAIAFALVGAVSSGLLAIGSYAVVERARTSDAQDRALVQARANLQLARSTGSVAQLQRRLASRPGFATVPVVDGKAQPGTLPVPADLTRLVGEGNLAYRWATIGGHRYLVVGAPSRGADLYFFFDEQQLQDDLDQLRLILFGAWLVLAALSALVGIVLARRVLAPVGEASAAARAIAEGLLETRLSSRSADEFGEWASSFNQMADALEAKIAALSLAREREQRFTADVAHELRTPLTALVNEAAILRDQIDRMPPDAQRASQMLTDDVTRLSRLVEDLLEISRLDAGAEPVRAEPVDLALLVRAVLDENGWSGAVAVDVDAPPMVSDRRRLERVIVNLIGNALLHGGGRAEVSGRVDTGRLVLTVTDHGPGIPADQRESVFGRFAKAGGGHGGSGLGLAIAREHAVALGGDVRLECEPGAGAAFTLDIPVAEPLPAGDGPVAFDGEDGDMSTRELSS